MGFEIVAQKLVDLGFYSFLVPFILVSAVMYGLLTKSKVLGDSVVINGVVSLVVGLIIFGLPTLIGISITKPVTAFFASTVSFILILVGGLLIAGVFFPGSEKLFEAFKGWGTWFIIAAFIFAIFSGLFQLPFHNVTSLPSVQTDILIVFGILLAAFIIIIIVTATRK
jgi:hypothetical protein